MVGKIVMYVCLAALAFAVEPVSAAIAAPGSDEGAYAALCTSLIPPEADRGFYISSAAPGQPVAQFGELGGDQNPVLAVRYNPNTFAVSSFVLNDHTSTFRLSVAVSGPGNQYYALSAVPGQTVPVFVCGLTLLPPTPADDGTMANPGIPSGWTFQSTASPVSPAQ